MHSLFFHACVYATHHYHHKAFIKVYFILKEKTRKIKKFFIVSCKILWE